MLGWNCVLLALVASCFATPPPNIIGGADASAGQIPWQVSLRSRNRHFCGGSILHYRWVLTAGHCLVGLTASKITVVSNTLLLNAGGDVYQVSRTIIHPEFNADSLRNDIGLLQVATDIMFNTNVQPAQVPTGPFTAVDYPATLSGWGFTSLPGTAANHLQYLNVTIISQQRCRDSSTLVTDSNICTFTRAGQGICHGDSGGPLTADRILVGVVSFGDPCAVGVPDAHARVWTFMPWISSKMQ